VTAWAQVAELVRQERRSSPNKSLTEAFRSVSARWVDFGLPETKERTIRSWITALESIERIEDDTDDEYVDYVRRLRSAPVAAVELIARWNRYDHPKSLKAARVIVGGRWSVDQLRKAEENARKESKNAVYGRQYAHRLGVQVRDWAELHLNPAFQRINVRLNDDPADFLFARSSKPDAHAAVLIFGPYTNEKEYESRFGSFMGIVAGLASYCERVVAIVPDRGARYWRWLLQRQLQGAGIEFYAVHYGASDFDPVQISRPAPDELVSQEN
jgi:hypothetical protein